MADNEFPELVFQHQHGPGLHEASFEDTLRELIRASPYLFLSIAIHVAVLAVFYFMPREVQITEEAQIIKATAEDFEEPIPPEPPPEEEEIEEIEEIVEEPVVTEEVVDEITEVIDNLNVDAAFDSTGLNDAIGVGGGAGGGFGRRGKLGKRGQKAGSATQQVVDDALKWLANHQNPEGYWAGAAFDLECGKLGDDKICDGLSNTAQHDVGLTGLALLAFLGAGHTDKEGKWKNEVKAGLRWLIDVQDSDGCFANTEIADYTYDHLIATLAMTEAYAITNRRQFKKPTTQALEYMYAIRNPGEAWRYADFHPEMLTHQNDVSVTGWAVLVMSLAKEYGLPYDKDAMEDSMLFIEAMTDEIGRTGYFERGGSPARLEEKSDIWDSDFSESMTAVGILCRIFADPELSNPGNVDMIEKGIKLIESKPIDWDEDEIGKIDFYYWYYATYALYQYSVEDNSAWKAWEKRMIGAIVEQQVKEGEEKGSWAPQVDPWGSVGGRVYSTALLALCLEVFYRYDTVIGSH